MISTINDPGMLTGAKTSFAEQATAFDTVANVYAPYYRQADALTVLSSPLATQNQICAGVPTHDATAAFAYYIEHSNHGRPARQGQPLCRRARRQTARSSCVQHVQRPPVRAGYRRRIPQGIFHLHDYVFYYFDLRHNAGNRIQHYLSTHEAEDG